MDTRSQLFEQARSVILTKAAEFYGRQFSNWGQFYGWLLDIDRDRLLDWEFQRIELWNTLFRKTAEPGDLNDLPVANLKRNAERAFALFGVDVNVARDSAYEIPRGGEWQIRLAHQMHDPDSPMNRGLEDWEQYDMAP
jgi:hypothetical protein